MVSVTYLEGSDASHIAQRTAFTQVSANHGQKPLLGIVVGNEYILSASSRGDVTANSTMYIVEDKAEVSRAVIFYYSCQGLLKYSW